MTRRLVRFAASAVVLLAATSGYCGDKPTKEYWVKLVCESADKIATVRFGPDGAVLEKATDTRILKSDISGPHGIAFSPDKMNFFVTIGHGRPYGTALKYDSDSDQVLKQVTLGYFPATADVTPDGNFLFAVNFNLHGDPVPSSVSVVDTNQMLEVARVPTCVMPHGSRVAHDGLHQYSACMMSDLLVEIDAQRMKVSRTFRVTAGKEQGYTGLPPELAESHEGMPSHAPMTGITCVPTWAQPSSDSTRVYVACNKSNEIVEVDAKDWKLVRRIPAGNGVYNLGVTSDGRLLLATNKKDASVSIFRTEDGKELARLKTKRKVVHGVAVSPDNRYAFFTVEGVGEEPGTVEVVDLDAMQVVAEVDTPPQAAGIDYWKEQ
ncbi:MAG TPA: YncE family protein [Candidatus Eisenbacteria bacterium]|nr:YncE family protein [Candidatus Eisenbacteria bacterium]